jgi:NADH:ubiquinone oxidoreductase subunit F (NADH-binding)
MTTTERVASATGAASGGHSGIDAHATTRILAAWARTGRSDLWSHLETHGSLPLHRRRDRSRAEELVEAVRMAGLTGRGGAGFPTARKLDSIRRARGRRLLVVNAMEGEPASRKDRALLMSAPHLVLDGAEVAAYAVAAEQIALCVPDDQDPSADSIGRALADRGAMRGDHVPAALVRPPGRYISGEESALVAWIDRRQAAPLFRPIKGVPLTVGRRPVLVQSAETLAHLALIARYGPSWFRTVGSAEAPGTCLVTVSGAVTQPGVYEVATGTGVDSVLGRAGAASAGPTLVGGYGGTWLHPDQLGTPYAPSALRAVGCTMGAGVLASIGPSACGVAETARVAGYMADESAGQCGPCAFGLPAIAADLFALAGAHSDRSALARLRHRLGVVDGRGACGHPDGVVRMVRSALEVFAADFAGHARGRPCPAWNRRPVLSIPVVGRPVRSSRR